MRRIKQIPQLGNWVLACVHIQASSLDPHIHLLRSVDGAVFVVPLSSDTRCTVATTYTFPHVVGLRPRLLILTLAPHAAVCARPLERWRYAQPHCYLEIYIYKCRMYVCMCL